MTIPLCHSIKIFTSNNGVGKLLNISLLPTMQLHERTDLFLADFLLIPTALQIYLFMVKLQLLQLLC